MKRYSHASLLLAVLLAATLAAAQMESATVQGQVVDAQGQPVADAVVTFHGANTGASFSVKTDKKGEFVRMGVRSDTYHATVTKDGQQIADLPSVPISYGDNPAVKITTVAPAAAAPKPAGTVALTPPQKQALEELQKLAAAAPKKKDEKQIKEKLQQGQTAMTAGNFDQAISLFTAVTTLDPMNEAAWAELGYCYAQTKQNNLAVPALEKAVAINPNYGGYHQNLGVAYAKTGKMDEALAELATAVQVDAPNAPRYYLYTGLLLAQEKKPDAAVAAFEKAIAADPKFADAYYFKGLTLMDEAKQVDGKLTAPQGTVESFKKYLELQPNGRFAAEVKGQLAKLGA